MNLLLLHLYVLWIAINVDLTHCSDGNTAEGGLSKTNSIEEDIQSRRSNHKRDNFPRLHDRGNRRRRRRHSDDYKNYTAIMEERCAGILCDEIKEDELIECKNRTSFHDRDNDGDASGEKTEDMRVELGSTRGLHKIKKKPFHGERGSSHNLSNLTVAEIEAMKTKRLICKCCLS